MQQVRKPQRIGLSATVRPHRRSRKLPLSGGASIVDVGHRREMDLSIEVPNDELGAVATSEMWAEIYDRIATSHLSAPHDAGLRQYASDVRAGCACTRRETRRECGAPASRQPLASTASRCGSTTKDRSIAGSSGDGISGTRASTSAPSISSFKSAPRDPLRSRCSASADRATGSARSRRACCSRPRETN